MSSIPEKKVSFEQEFRLLIFINHTWLPYLFGKPQVFKKLFLPKTLLLMACLAINGFRGSKHVSFQ